MKQIKQQQTRRKYQHGMSLWGWLCILMFVSLAANIAVKIVPYFYDASLIEKVFEGLPTDTSLQGASTREIQANLMRKIDINHVTYITQEQLDVRSDGRNGVYVVTLDYEQRVPLFKHIDAILWFKNKATVITE